MSEHVLITGGTGFIGSHLANRLAQTNRQITVLEHDTGTNKGDLAEDIQTVKGDITERSKIPSLQEFDSVYHLAGVVSVSESLEKPYLTYSVNTEGTQNILERARNDCVDDFLYLSSAAIYGQPEQLPIGESHPIQPTHPYAATKAAGENLVRGYGAAYDLDTTIARAFTVYGPGQSEDHLIPTVIEEAISGGPIRLGNMYPTRDFVHVEDVVSALETLTSQDTKYDVYNIGSGQESSVRDVVETILNELGTPELETISEDIGRSSEVEIERMVSDNSRIREIGWAPKYDLRKGIKDTVQSIKS